MATEPLVAAISASATVSANLVENLIARVTQQQIDVLARYQSTATTNVVVTQQQIDVLAKYPFSLTASISASATVATDLTLLYSTVRLTQQAAEVLYTPSDTDTPIRLTQQSAEVLYTPSYVDTPVRLTQQSIEVLYTYGSGALTTSITASATVTADLSETIKELNSSIVASAQCTASIIVTYGLTSNIYAAGNLFAFFNQETLHLEADITTAATVTAAMVVPKFKAGILGTGSLYGKLTGLQQYEAAITANAFITADIDNKQELSSAITASALVAADLRENVEYLAADIVTSTTVTAILNAPWHAGNALTVTDLTQTVEVALVQVFSITSTLNLTQTPVAIYGLNYLSASNSITFTQSVEVKHTLPTETTDSTLALTQDADYARQARNTLRLRHNLTGVIYFLTGTGSSSLNLSQSVSTAKTVFLRSVISSLELDQTVNADQVVATNGNNSLSFSQHAYGLIIATKKYVVFQAPFDFIQTSMVTPSPLMGDTENLISNLTLHRSMSGSIRTHVKSSNNRRLKYTFSVDRPKGLEMEAFFQAYNGSIIKMINWKGEIWKVKLVNNPLDFVQTRRAEPNGDRTEVNIELEGVKLSG